MNRRHPARRQRPLASTLISTALLVGLAAHAAEAVRDDKIIRESIWSLAKSGTERRWLVIHNLEEAHSTGIYHVEVLARAPGSKPWEFRRLAAHMALTETALRNSIVAPLKKGAVYPEVFDDAYAKWRAQSQQGHAEVCRTAVIECLNPTKR